MQKRVYALYRVSTKGQVEKDDIPMQKEACRAFAKEQGWEIVKEFSEKGVSGFKKSAKERDQLQKIQQAAMAKEFDVLLVFMFDRLGRRDDETPFVVEWFVKQGIEVWSTQEGEQRFDTHVDKLMNYIRYWQASGESIKTSIRTRTRMEQLTEEGLYTGGVVAYGYRLVKRGRINKRNHEVYDLEIDEKEAEVVRLIFQKYVYEGYGAKRLCNYLCEQNIMGRNGQNIPNVSIVRMIKNKSYTGYLINGNVETHCPELQIIEPDLFERAQEVRQARKREKGANPLSYSSQALLCGIVFCAHCGNRLSLASGVRKRIRADGTVTREKRIRYSCNYNVRHPGQCDGQSGYGVITVDNIVESVVRMKFAEIRECSKQKLLEEMRSKELNRIQKQIQQLERELETKRQEQDVLKEETLRVIQGKSGLDRDMLADLVAENKEAVLRAGDALQKAKQEQKEVEEAAKKMQRECSDLFTWANVYDNADFNERQAILHQFIKEVRVGRNYEVDIVLNVSLEEFEEFKAHSMAGSTKKTGQMDLKPAPENLSGSSNASIVVMDENADQPLNILPRNLVRASVTYSN
ncbi:recombinase family protein [Faecalibacterium sp. An192]|uniref:recombinase family protein n=1 Tax=Faecalibacterium sp. An192 TaxID=1965581 RepID=UPI000B367D86|nr:recombinase family protein [Faecalibacterium sp. An192]OUP29161.1 recombinase family protein [Faecalibacterium sp. An192]